jgi:hypothetical protein
MRGKPNRGARIRTGDLCDPNAALYRTEPRPGTTGYLAVLNGRRGMELAIARSSRSLRSLESNPPHVPLRAPRGFEHEDLSYGRGGIRTHAGFRPHDFQSCALSHSATRPKRLWDSQHDSFGGSGMELAALAPLASLRSLESNPLHVPLRGPCGFEPHDHGAFHFTEGVGFSCGASRLAALRPSRTHFTSRFAVRVGSNP